MSESAIDPKTLAIGAAVVVAGVGVEFAKAKGAGDKKNPDKTKTIDAIKTAIFFIISTNSLC
jgi:hypothetical protein